MQIFPVDNATGIYNYFAKRFAYDFNCPYVYSPADDVITFMCVHVCMYVCMYVSRFSSSLLDYWRDLAEILHAPWAPLLCHTGWFFDQLFAKLID